MKKIRYTKKIGHIKNKLFTIIIIGTLLLTLGCGDTLDGEESGEGEASAIYTTKVINLYSHTSY